MLRHLKPVRDAAIALLLIAIGVPQAPAADRPAVAAASDLQFALTEVAEAFHRETGHGVRLIFGSSGNIATQIQHGAPFEMFLSADEELVAELAQRGFAEGAGELYAIGRIVIFVPHGSPLKADPELVDLRAATTDGRLTRLAIANPEHAPYGRRAEEALRHAGIWGALSGKLVLGENVSQAAQFATSGDADGGIIALSLVLSPNLSGLGSYALLPEGWHQPLRQRMVLLNNHREVAAAFFSFMQTAAARSVMTRYGFSLPSESAM
jgi:molybdate transport system substrate-binding protein